MRRIGRGGRRGRLASEGRCLARGSGGSSRSKRRKAWGVCGRGGRSVGFRGEGLSREAIEREKGVSLWSFDCFVCGVAIDQSLSG